MNFKTLKGDIYFLGAAFIWGTTFIVQKKAMDGMGPFTLTGLRFLLGGIVLALFLVFKIYVLPSGKTAQVRIFSGKLIRNVSVLSVILFIGMNLQQIGLQYTSPTHSAMITSVYILLVPIFLYWGGRHISIGIWISGLMAITGLYLLMVPGLKFDFQTLNLGDLYALSCASFWAIHIIYLERTLNSGEDPLSIATLQSIFCGGLSLLTAFVFENVTWQLIHTYSYELIYAGILSISFGFLFQVLGQRLAPAQHASIIMGLEGLFAAIADYFYFGTQLTVVGYLGAFLMICAVITVQFQLVWAGIRKLFFSF